MSSLLEALASSDAGPVVADMLDGGSLQELALAGKAGRALSERRTSFAVCWAQSLDLTVGRWASRCVQRLTISTNFANPFLRTVRLPPTVRRCLLHGTLMHPHEVRAVRAALPDNAELWIDGCAFAVEDGPAPAPVVVDDLVLDWVRCETVWGCVRSETLRSLRCHWSTTDIERWPALPRLEVLDLAFRDYASRGRENDDPLVGPPPMGQILVRCWGLPRLRTLHLSRLQYSPAVHLPPNDTITDFRLTGVWSRGRPADIGAQLRTMRALTRLELSNDVDLGSLHGLGVAELTLNCGRLPASFRDVRLPRLWKLRLRERGPCGRQGLLIHDHCDLNLPNSPALTHLDVNIDFREASFAVGGLREVVLGWLSRTCAAPFKQTRWDDRRVGRYEGWYRVLTRRPGEEDVGGT